MRKLSSSLPRFNSGARPPRAEKETQGRGLWTLQNVPLVGRVRGFFSRMGRKLKIRLLVGFAILLSVWLISNSRKLFLHGEPNWAMLTPSAALVYHWRRTTWLGGGQKYVIILAANVGGGVIEWKGAREWAIERDSTRNKQKYVARWGYDLEIVDMSTKKRYAHEWRESWEKVDFLRQCLRKYPKAKW